MELTVFDRLVGIIPDVKGLSDYCEPVKRNEVYLTKDTLEVDGCILRFNMHLRLYRKKGKPLGGTLNYITDEGINITSLIKNKAGEYIDITVSFKNIEEIGIAKPDEFGMKLVRIPFENTVNVETLHSRKETYTRGDSVALIPKGVFGYFKAEKGKIEDIIDGKILINNRCIDYKDLKTVLKN